MTIDVVVVSYKSGGKLNACLTAARRFLGDRARLIVVDNSPGDGAVETAKLAHPDLRLIESSGNVGFAAAVNRGIEAATGDLVLLLNPDVTAFRGEWSAVERVFADDPDVAAVSPRLLNLDGSIQHIAKREPDIVDFLYFGLGRQRPGRGGWDARYYMDEWDYASSRVVDTVFGACLFLRRIAVEDVGLLDDVFFVYAEETDWLIRAKRRGWKTVFLADVEATHLQRESTEASEETLTLLLMESYHRYARKHFGSINATLLRASLAAADSLRLVRAAARGRKNASRRRYLRQRLKLHLTGRTIHPA